jgi:hypothetical protein
MLHHVFKIGLGLIESEEGKISVNVGDGLSEVDEKISVATGSGLKIEDNKVIVNLDKNLIEKEDGKVSVNIGLGLIESEEGKITVDAGAGLFQTSSGKIVVNVSDGIVIVNGKLLINLGDGLVLEKNKVCLDSNIDETKSYFIIVQVDSKLSIDAQKLSLKKFYQKYKIFKNSAGFVLGIEPGEIFEDKDDVIIAVPYGYGGYGGHCGYGYGYGGYGGCCPLPYRTSTKDMPLFYKNK